MGWRQEGRAVRRGTGSSGPDAPWDLSKDESTKGGNIDNDHLEVVTGSAGLLSPEAETELGVQKIIGDRRAGG